MNGHWIIVLIYLSFFLDFVVWPVKSEGSTRSLSSRYSRSDQRALLWSIFVLNLIFYLLPLFFAINNLSFDTRIEDVTGALGLGIAVMGRGVTLTGAVRLRNAPKGQLVQHSVFKHTRNPISLGMHLTVMGFLLVFNAWFLWVGLVFYLVNIDRKIRVEEDYLKKTLGEEYIHYLKQTPRYL